MMGCAFALRNGATRLVAASTLEGSLALKNVFRMRSSSASRAYEAGITTMTPSAPIPNLRSHSVVAFSCASRTMMPSGSSTASIITKSFPIPCIFVNCINLLSSLFPVLLGA